MMTNQYFQSVRVKVLTRQTCVAICFTAALVVLAACSSGTKRPQPAELTAVTPLVAAPQLWTARVGLVTFPLQPGVASNTVSLASDDGTVAMLDAKTGRDIWRVALATAISAGVGSDGVTAAVVTKANELVTLRSGRE